MGGVLHTTLTNKSPIGRCDSKGKKAAKIGAKKRVKSGENWKMTMFRTLYSELFSG